MIHFCGVLKWLMVHERRTGSSMFVKEGPSHLDSGPEPALVCLPGWLLRQADTPGSFYCHLAARKLALCWGNWHCLLMASVWVCLHSQNPQYCSEEASLATEATAHGQIVATWELGRLKEVLVTPESLAVLRLTSVAVQTVYVSTVQWPMWSSFGDLWKETGTNFTF